MAHFTTGNKQNGSDLNIEYFNGYERISGDVYENGTNYWISEIRTNDGHVEGTKTNRATGAISHYSYNK